MAARARSGEAGCEMVLERFFHRDRVGELEVQVARLTRRVDALVAELGVTLDERLPADVESRIRVLIAQGKTIAAIKLYREATGEGLREAKAAVDAMAREGPRGV